MKFNLKSFILGGIVGAMLFSIAPIYATVQQYILTKSEWKLVNNDGEAYTDKEYPALMLNGSNYVPVGKIAQFLGVDFTVDGKTKTATFNTEKKTVETSTNTDTSVEENYKIEKYSLEFNIYKYKNEKYIEISTLKYICDLIKPNTDITWTDDDVMIIKNAKDILLQDIPYNILPYKSSEIGCVSLTYFNEYILKILEQ